jgi:hypothetical protein
VTEQPRVARARFLPARELLRLTALLDLPPAWLRLRVELSPSDLRNSTQLALRVQLLALQVPERWPAPRQRGSSTIALPFHK